MDCGWKSSLHPTVGKSLMDFKRCTLHKSGKEWEIKDPNNDSCPLVGPYNSKELAESDRDGLNAFYIDKKNWKLWESIDERKE